MTNDIIWEKFLSIIQKEVSPITFNCIIKQLKLYSYNNSKMIITTSENNELLLEKVKQNYSNLIENIMNEITQDSCEIHYLLKNEINDSTNIIENNNIQTKNFEETLENDLSNYKYNSNFISKYTFDTFVVGESNKLAYGTAKAVAQNPGKLYNPYFIYSNSGLGKTHLMHAIGNYIVTHSDKRVLYITAEQFSNDYISIVNTKKY